MTALAIDIGASKIVACHVGPDGTTGEARSVRTPTSGVWQACVTLLESLGRGEQTEALGISVPGPLDDGIAAPINIPEWADGFAVDKAARDQFPAARIELAMDGQCAALGEYAFGSARGTTDLLGVVVSSGVGGGIVRHGRVVLGRTGNAGHIGHIPVPGGTEACACGGIGCLETVASGPAAVRWAQAQGWPGTSGAELAGAAQAGDEYAIAALDRAGTALGTVLAGAAALLDVDLVTIGGGFAQSGPPLWEPLQAALARHSGLRYLSGVAVLPGQLGARASLAGAVALVDDGYRPWPN
ncbi:ROK family protein [Aldersonia kunmingensis]|uniref:ROK family protein n=1 Tax=Aldersonia kunmingensis TaxID=408066 RepID=UPI00082B273A|nr:ROK family protein [Aldersonia kunmingensis]